VGPRRSRARWSVWTAAAPEHGYSRDRCTRWRRRWCSAKECVLVLSRRNGVVECIPSSRELVPLSKRCKCCSCALQLLQQLFIE
ncbi:MAG: hypothetical protein ACPIOQ_81290, partial [Promethearchaeia archaeon]